ncbi:hypothetical protein L479_00945 [Exiguobacterium sp. S17]|nr:hypothetical protein L479_00945 [Exiguobacterium sp. S17]
MKGNVIRDIIQDRTMYDQGKYRMYLNLSDLNLLLDDIITTNTTTDYIRITPFYINERCLNSREHRCK